MASRRLTMTPSGKRAACCLTRCRFGWPVHLCKLHMLPGQLRRRWWPLGDDDVQRLVPALRLWSCTACARVS
eukprot:SAG22_NODE_693_length_7872_cov_13.111797_6_plen_72_part_00